MYIRMKDKQFNKQNSRKTAQRKLNSEIKQKNGGNW